MWWGGSAFGPRHLIPSLPFVCLGILPALESRLRLAVWLTLGLSIAHALGATAVGPEAPFEGDQLAHHVYPFLFANHVAVESGTSNLGLYLRLPGVLSLLPLLAIWASSVVVLRSAEP
jgi:hypothetical protein